jgi:hypothetical protein
MNSKMQRGALLGLVLLLAAGVSCVNVSIVNQEISDGQPTSASAGQGCPQYGEVVGNVVINGGFEEGQHGWELTSTGTGATWREHELIGEAPGFEPRSGTWAARLGGHEGSFDRLEQQVIIPTGGLLTFWWQIRRPRPVSRLTVSLASPDGSQGIVLAVHDDGKSETGWQQDCIDLSQYAGQEYVLRIHVANDNYTMTAFDIDDVELGSAEEPQ